MSRTSKKPINNILVLSGGGGRGAYQVGVCMVLEKKGWRPDMVLGNSIGATNGAILLAPSNTKLTAAENLKRVWLEDMTNSNLHEMSGQFPQAAGKIIGKIIKILQALQEPRDRRGREDLWKELLDFVASVMPEGRNGELTEGQINEFLGKFLLDVLRQLILEGLNQPPLMKRDGWRRLLKTHVKWRKLIAESSPYFGVAATDAATGALHMFWNHIPPGLKSTGTQLTNPGQLHKSVMASSSIPAFYDATRLKGPAIAAAGDRYWWDGALVANTPIAPVIDLVENRLKKGEADRVEIVVVLMTPWFYEAQGSGLPYYHNQPPPPTLLDGLARFIDWMMLAPLRCELRRLHPLLDALNASRSKKEESSKIHIIAPEKLTSVIQIIDYGVEDSKKLMCYGMKDALDVLNL